MTMGIYCNSYFIFERSCNFFCTTIHQFVKPNKYFFLKMLIDFVNRQQKYPYYIEAKSINLISLNKYQQLILIWYYYKLTKLNITKQYQGEHKIYYVSLISQGFMLCIVYYSQVINKYYSIQYVLYMYSILVSVNSQQTNYCSFSQL